MMCGMQHVFGAVVLDPGGDSSLARVVTTSLGQFSFQIFTNYPSYQSSFH
jgi:hypothetical protein